MFQPFYLRVWNKLLCCSSLWTGNLFLVCTFKVLFIRNIRSYITTVQLSYHTSLKHYEILRNIRESLYSLFTYYFIHFLRLKVTRNSLVTNSWHILESYHCKDSNIENTCLIKRKHDKWRVIKLYLLISKYLPIVC